MPKVPLESCSILYGSYSSRTCNCLIQDIGAEVAPINCHGVEVFGHLGPLLKGRWLYAAERHMQGLPCHGQADLLHV